MIIVTGATGFIGSAFVWELNQRGHNQDILCVDTFEHDERWKNLNKRKFNDFIMKDDLFSFLETDIAKKEVSFIVHMGANSSTTATDGNAVMESNYYYTQKLFHWCADNNKHFIYASSGATYGLGEKGYDDSTSSFELSPLNLYGYSKVLFDRYFESQISSKGKLPPTCYGLKFFNVYGPQEYHKGDMASVVFKAYSQISKRGDLALFRSKNPEYKDGYQMRDFVYVKDITRWIYELMNKKNTQGIFNMGYGQARPWMDLAQAVFKNMNKPVQIDWIDMPDYLAPKYQYFTEAKMNKLMEHGLSQPQFALETGVSDYITNYLLEDDKYL